jgi:hypothetical protein
MSENHATHRVRAEVDRIASGKVVFVGLASLVLFFLASVGATRMLAARRAELLPEGPPPLPGEAGSPKIGIVEQQLFANTNTGERWRAEQRRRLDGYGWVDRGAGVIHIPVDRAMDLVAGGERP